MGALHKVSETEPGWGGGREGEWRVEDLLVGAAEKDEPGTSFCAIK